MQEIHAYQNDDGTYRVEILNIELDKETTNAKLEIPRALIDITSLPSNDEDIKRFAIIIDEENIK